MRIAIIAACVATAIVIAACAQEPRPPATPLKSEPAQRPVVLAHSPCRGLSQTACRAREACGWTNSYARADGKPVAGYCHITTQKSP